MIHGSKNEEKLRAQLSHVKDGPNKSSCKVFFFNLNKYYHKLCCPNICPLHSCQINHNLVKIYSEIPEFIVVG